MLPRSVETDWHRHVMAHDDAREGVRGFTEGRAPRWTGRVSELPAVPAPSLSGPARSEGERA